MEEADLVIIGAGLNGLTTAHTYHQLHPSAKLIILESEPSIGGPWARERIFPGLKTNNLWGMFEHPDFPMDEQRFGVQRGAHMDAEKILQYLTAFIEWADIKQFIRLRTKVQVIEKDDEEGDWIVHTTSSSSGEQEVKIRAKKLVVAVGITNEPVLPRYSKATTFRPPVLHSRDFATRYSEIAKPKTHTVVVGSGKSAWDVAYACATQPGSTATLLIRPSGNGPVFMTPSHVTPFGLWLEKLVHTRFFGFLSPCPWATTTGVEGWLRSFFHQTWLGRKVVAAFWTVLGEDAIALNKLDSHPETKKLRPWRSAFEVGNALSIHNYPSNFFDLVRDGKVKIVIDDIASLQDEHEVCLKSGTTLHADAVVCATGWQKGYTFRFEPASLEKQLGVPSSQPLTPEEEALIASSEASLYKTFPYLKDRDTSRVAHPDPTLRHVPQEQASIQQQKKQTQPYRLHRFIAPPRLLDEHNVAFAGALHCLGTFPCAYIQSLWIAAYFDNKLAVTRSLSPALRARLIKETYRDTQYCTLRGAMSYGQEVPDLVFDSMPYFDMLLADLGLEGRRKGGAVSEWVSGYGPEDYRGLLTEVERRERARERRDG